MLLPLRLRRLQRPARLFRNVMPPRSPRSPSFSMHAALDGRPGLVRPSYMSSCCATAPDHDYSLPAPASPRLRALR